MEEFNEPTNEVIEDGPEAEVEEKERLPTLQEGIDELLGE